MLISYLCVWLNGCLLLLHHIHPHDTPSSHVGIGLGISFVTGVRVGSGTVVCCVEAGVVGGGGGDGDRLPSLLLSKTTAAAFSHVGISGTFSTGVWCDGMIIVMCGTEVAGVVGVMSMVCFPVEVAGRQNLSAPAPIHLPALTVVDVVVGVGVGRVSTSLFTSHICCSFAKVSTQTFLMCRCKLR